MKNNLKKITFNDHPCLCFITAVFAIGSFNGCKVQYYTAKVSTISIEPVAAKIGSTKRSNSPPAQDCPTARTSAMADNSVTWTSSDTTIATISATGLATAGTTTGTTTITAADANGIKGIATLEIGMVKSRIAGNHRRIARESFHKYSGRTSRFTATGTYDDASTQDVTALVTWTSSDETAVTIDAASGYVQVPSSATVGATATITATLTDAGSGTTITGNHRS